MSGRRIDLRNLRDKTASTTTGAARGLRRVAFWTLFVGGLLLLLVVLGAGGIGLWLIFNADAALAWLNGVVSQLGPLVSPVRAT